MQDKTLFVLIAVVGFAIGTINGTFNFFLHENQTTALLFEVIGTLALLGTVLVDIRNKL